MGIDYGHKKVGVAFSDEGGLMAFPHSVIANSPDLLETLCKLVKEKECQKLLLGTL